jgi:hypothetical protein
MHAPSADEAGQYLTAYKQSEHRPPTLIRERVDKTPDALLRTALTSIPRVNKTDVETLRSVIRRASDFSPIPSFSSLLNGAHRASRRSHRQTRRNSSVSLDLARKKSLGSKTRLSGPSVRARRAMPLHPRHDCICDDISLHDLLRLPVATAEVVAVARTNGRIRSGISSSISIPLA